MTDTILIVDDDPVQRRLLSAAAEKFGYEALVAPGGAEALALLAEPRGKAVTLIILDLVMPGMGGLDVLNALRTSGSQLPVIVQTAQGGIETVVGAMRAGAFDFVVKPVSPERLRVSIANALKVEKREDETRRRVKSDDSDLGLDDLVTSSAAMRRVIALGRKAAASGIPILIEGESGSGKEVVARAIRAASARAGEPFVTVNCGAIPDNLVESILFGHEKGSFTGAVERHSGKFVEAHGGTLFLDEIGDLPLDAQVKLLRAVQTGEVDPVGAKSSRKVDIRLISATHRNLGERVAEGRFREDLYYRLNVFPIAVPPLRERREDIEGLVRRFADRFAADEGRPGRMDLTPAVRSMLQAYDWPGNIRQLENAVFRAVVLADGDLLTVAEFPQIRAQVEGADFDLDPIVEVAVAGGEASQSQPNAAPTIAGAVSALDGRGEIRPLADVELEMIQLAIDHYQGQMSEVARRLGIGRSTLYRKLKEYGIDPDQTRMAS